jgi:hypothetical protein
MAVAGKAPGLYNKNGVKVSEGAEIKASEAPYTYRGYGAIVSSNNVTELIHSNGEDYLTLDFSDHGMDSDDLCDARCVYAYYDKSGGTPVWSAAYGATTTPAEETEISLNPYYICLGVLLSNKGTLYWHYKTMKSNISISGKR